MAHMAPGPLLLTHCLGVMLNLSMPAAPRCSLTGATGGHFFLAFGGFQTMGALLEVPRVRIIVYWGPLWGPHVYAPPQSMTGLLLVPPTLLPPFVVSFIAVFPSLARLHSGRSLRDAKLLVPIPRIRGTSPTACRRVPHMSADYAVTLPNHDHETSAQHKIWDVTDLPGP